MGVENFLAPTSVTLGKAQRATEAEHNLPCPHGKVRTAHPIATKLGRYIPLKLTYGEIMPQVLAIFFVKC